MAATTTNSGNVTQTTESNECHMWRLPAELRLTIYDDVLKNFTIRVEDEDKCVTPPLIQVCRTFYHEAKEKYMERLEHLASEAKHSYRQIRDERLANLHGRLSPMNPRLLEAAKIFGDSIKFREVVEDRVALEMRKMARAAGEEPEEKYKVVLEDEMMKSHSFRAPFHITLAYTHPGHAQEAQKVAKRSS